MIFGKSEEIEEIEVDVKEVVPLKCTNYLIKTLEKIGRDVRLNYRNRGSVDTKALVQARFDGNLHLTLSPAVNLYDIDSVTFEDEKYIVLNHDVKMSRDDILYVWCVVQRVNKVKDDYYDTLLHPFDLP